MENNILGILVRIICVSSLSQVIFCEVHEVILLSREDAEQTGACISLPDDTGGRKVYTYILGKGSNFITLLESGLFLGT